MATFSNETPAGQLAYMVLHAAYRLTGREQPLRRDAGAGDIETVKAGVTEIARRYQQDRSLVDQALLKPLVEVLSKVTDMRDIKGAVSRGLSTLDAPNPEEEQIPPNPFASFQP